MNEAIRRVLVKASNRLLLSLEEGAVKNSLALIPEMKKRLRFRWLVKDKVAMSRQPAAEDRTLLSLMGVDEVLNLREDKDPFPAFNIPIPDGGLPKKAKLNHVLKWIGEVVYEGKAVLIHCKNGVGRTALVASAYLMRTEGLTADEAMTKVIGKIGIDGMNEKQKKFLRKMTVTQNKRQFSSLV